VGGGGVAPLVLNLFNINNLKLHALTASNPPGKEPGYTMNMRLGGPIYCHCRESNHDSSDFQPSHYTGFLHFRSTSFKPLLRKRLCWKCTWISSHSDNFRTPFTADKAQATAITPPSTRRHAKRVSSLRGRSSLASAHTKGMRFISSSSYGLHKYCIWIFYHKTVFNVSLDLDRPLWSTQNVTR